MITVEFAEGEAQAVADAVRAYIDDDYYPAIDLDGLKTAYQRLTRAISNQGLEVKTTSVGHSGDLRPC